MRIPGKVTAGQTVDEAGEGEDTSAYIDARGAAAAIVAV